MNIQAVTQENLEVVGSTWASEFSGNMRQDPASIAGIAKIPAYSKVKILTLHPRWYHKFIES